VTLRFRLYRAADVDDDGDAERVFGEAAFDDVITQRILEVCVLLLLLLLLLFVCLFVCFGVNR
jgi:hypothetical protein